MATAAEKEALGLLVTATDADVLARIADLVASEEAFDNIGKVGSHAGGERKVLGVIAKGPNPFRRGTYIVPNDRVLVLDESKMDPANIQSLDEEANIIKFRSSDPFTPESEVERTKRS